MNTSSSSHSLTTDQRRPIRILPDSSVADEEPHPEAPPPPSFDRDTFLQSVCKVGFFDNTHPCFMHGRANPSLEGSPLEAPNCTWKCAKPPRDDHSAPSWLTGSEFQDTPATLEHKCAQLAQLIKISRKTVVRVFYDSIFLSLEGFVGLLWSWNQRVSRNWTGAEQELLVVTWKLIRSLFHRQLEGTSRRERELMPFPLSLTFVWLDLLATASCTAGSSRIMMDFHKRLDSHKKTSTRFMAAGSIHRTQW